MNAMFLSTQEIGILTGFQRKGRQIVQLKGMGIPFFVNGSGRPVVTRAAIEGRKEKRDATTWLPHGYPSASPDMLNRPETAHVTTSCFLDRTIVFGRDL
jgi:Domain of unknown function (DUF4224)